MSDLAWVKCLKWINLLNSEAAPSQPLALAPMQSSRILWFWGRIRQCHSLGRTMLFSLDSFCISSFLAPPWAAPTSSYPSIYSFPQDPYHTSIFPLHEASLVVSRCPCRFPPCRPCQSGTSSRRIAKTLSLSPCDRAADMKQLSMMTPSSKQSTTRVFSGAGLGLHAAMPSLSSSGLWFWFSLAMAS